MKILENTAQEWNKLYEEMINKKDYSIEINLDVAMRNMYNLRYFLPLAYKLYKSEVPQVTLIIIPIAVPEKQIEGDIKRLSLFFSEWEKIPYIQIQIGTRKLPSINWFVSRIFPICNVVCTEDVKQDEKRYLYYINLKTCYYDSVSRRNIPLKDKDNENNENYLIRYCNQLLDWLSHNDNFKGSCEGKIQKGNKIQLESSMEDFVYNHLADMNILAQTIWLYILRDLLETKQLYSIPDPHQKGDSRVLSSQINIQILKKSRLDAITYAESLYQVIENACFYSKDHQAWFGFRMHRAGKKVALSELAEEVQNREVLYRKYKKCFGKKTVNSDDETYSYSTKNIFIGNC